MDTKFNQFKIQCLPHLGGGDITISMPWIGISLEDFKTMMATATGYIPPKKTEEDRQKEIAESLAARDRAEHKRFEKAEKIKFGSQPFPMYYSKSMPDNDGYFEELEELIEACEFDDCEMPSYVWGCREVHAERYDAQDIVERGFDCLYEDAMDQVSEQSIAELQAALDKFYEANKGIIGYQPSYKVALLLEGDK